MKVTGDLPNLINGVSQQSPTMRLVSQVDEQKNFYSTIVRGLKKRPPSQHIAKISSIPTEGAFIHFINRDDDEKFVAVVTEGQIKVFDFQGNEKTVYYPDGADYLTDIGNPELTMSALTIADYTFILNKSIIAKLDSASAIPLRSPEAIVNITAGNYGCTYQIRINNSVAAEYSTPPGNDANAVDSYGNLQVQAISTTEIAKRLYEDLLVSLGNTGAPWGVGIHQNAIHIVNYSYDFTISGSDGVNMNAMRICKDQVQRFSDLPNCGPHGFVVEITGTDGNKFDNYYVQADKGGTNNNSVITWKEIPKPGKLRTFNPNSMPHALVKRTDGNFDFKQIEWDSMKCGNGVDTSPPPSFVDKPITSMFFHRGRFGFLSDESVILSRSSSFFDFWRTTATTLLDDDPIDVSAAHLKVSMLKHAVPFQDSLLLFSSETQFRLAGNELLTPKTASIRPLTEYSNSPRVQPEAIGRAVFFVSDSLLLGDFVQVHEYTYAKSSDTVEAAKITAHVPGYIPAGVHKISGSSDEGVLALLTKGEPDSIYLYRYYWNDGTKVQSSWSKWVLDGADILSIKFINYDLYLVVNRADGVFLEKMKMNTAAEDPELGFMVNLDRRVAKAISTYDAVDKVSTFTLPWTPVIDGLTVVVLTPASGTEAVPATGQLKVNYVEDYTVAVDGDHRGATVIVGYPYESRFRFSTLYLKGQGANGAAGQARQDGRLQITQMTVDFTETAYFKAIIACDGRPPSNIVFNANVMGTGIGRIGELSLEDGRKTISVMSKNDRVTIDIVNDTWLPSAFTSANWRGLFNQTSRGF